MWLGCNERFYELRMKLFADGFFFLFEFNFFLDFCMNVVEYDKEVEGNVMKVW